VPVLRSAERIAHDLMSVPGPDTRVSLEGELNTRICIMATSAKRPGWRFIRRVGQSLMAGAVPAHYKLAILAPPPTYGYFLSVKDGFSNCDGWSRGHTSVF
jgi:hypothetical protein